MTQRPESDEQRPTPGPTPTPSPRPAAPNTSSPATADTATSAPKADAAPSAPAPTPAKAAPQPAASPRAGNQTDTNPAKPALAPAASVERAKKFSRADEDGTVYVTVDGAEHVAGQFPDATTPDEAIAYFARKFDDAEAQIDLLQQRLEAKAPTTDMRKTLNQVLEQISAHNMAGDLAGLRSRIDTLEVAVGAAELRQAEEQKRARAEQLAHRTAIVEAAEEVAAQDTAKTQWKQSTTRMAELFSQWQDHQRSHGRLSKSDEESLWKRFRKARTTFDRHRKAYFSQLDEVNAKAKRIKEGLIAEAEQLAHSTDWGITAGKFRDLMDRWKESPRASRKDDDALWNRFRAAQDTFFEARKADNAKIDKEFAANLVVKEELLKEAKAILPVKNLSQAKKQLASIQQRWEEAGKVPRNDMRRVENELRAVEDAVKSAEDEKWRRTDPETKARSNSMLSQLENKIADQEAALAKAQASGDTKRVAAVEKDLATSRQWLETLQRSAQQLG